MKKQDLIDAILTLQPEIDLEGMTVAELKALHNDLAPEVDAETDSDTPPRRIAMVRKRYRRNVQPHNVIDRYDALPDEVANLKANGWVKDNGQFDSESEED